MNDGIEERFYIPLEYYLEWNKIVIENRLGRFRLGSTGVPNCIPKDNSHWEIQANLRSEAEGLPPIENLLLREFRGV